MVRNASDAMRDAQYALVRHTISANSAIRSISYWRGQQIASAVEKSRMVYFMMWKNRDAMKYVETGEMMGDINVMMGIQQTEMDAQEIVK